MDEIISHSDWVLRMDVARSELLSRVGNFMVNAKLAAQKYNCPTKPTDSQQRADFERIILRQAEELSGNMKLLIDLYPKES